MLVSPAARNNKTHIEDGLVLAKNYIQTMHDFTTVVTQARNVVVVGSFLHVTVPKVPSLCPPVVAHQIPSLHRTPRRRCVPR